MTLHARSLALAMAATAMFSTAASAGLLHQTYTAVVNKFGVLKRGAGATSAQLLSDGHYQVTFSPNVDSCTVVATLGRAPNDGGFAWRPGFVAVANTVGDTHSILVETRSASGNPRNAPFHIFVAC